MNDMWRKIVEVVRKTGDRCLIADPITEEIFVLMDLASYERLLGKEFSNLTQKTNPIKIEPDFIPASKELEPDWEDVYDDSFAEPSQEPGITDDRFYLEPIE